ncbi:MAG: Na+/H+ antiporter NhaA [Actinobacteria bacterium]|nr:Na+/H+ antiporter NhaA [Actinomycetota bacterium]
MIRRLHRRVVGPLQEFLQTEAAGGTVLLLATALALALANLPTKETFFDVLEHELTLGFGDWAIRESVEAWVNDALMTIFFFVAGLEIKRELVEGELRDRRTAALPIMAALGGMVVPALVYTALNAGEPSLRGAGIPVATDIAFAVGVVILMGRRVPAGLKVFLLTLAIADDIGGIVVIALFYGTSISGPWLASAAIGILGIWAMRRVGVSAIWPYVIVGAWVWLATYESGIHATIAGVVLGLMTPVAPVKGRRIVHQLEHRLHPWSSYLVIPVFALANAGVDFGGGALDAALRSRVTWGVAAGLLVGKTVGVTATTMIAVRARIGRLPSGMTPRHVVGMGMLAGIGFTVALFVAQLSFPAHPEFLEHAKVGIFLGSLVSAAAGWLWLSTMARRAEEPATSSAEPGAAPEGHMTESRQKLDAESSPS